MNGPYYQPPAGPVRHLESSRSLLKYILLSIVTFGIYSLVFYSGISSDINTIAGRYDNKHTMHYCLLFFLIGPFTLGIGYLVWYHFLSARVGMELRRRGIAYDFSAGSFWLWHILGALFAVGPFIYIHKLAKATNLLAESYNYYG